MRNKRFLFTLLHSFFAKANSIIYDLLLNPNPLHTREQDGNVFMLLDINFVELPKLAKVARYFCFHFMCHMGRQDAQEKSFCNPRKHNV